MINPQQISSLCLVYCIELGGHHKGGASATLKTPVTVELTQNLWDTISDLALGTTSRLCHPPCGQMGYDIKKR